MIYFAWTTEEAVFDPQIHARLDEKIVDLVLTEKEGEPAEVTAEIPNPGIHHIEWMNGKKWAFISYLDHENNVLPLIKVLISDCYQTHDSGMIVKFRMNLEKDRKAYLEEAAKMLKSSWHDPADDYFADTTLAQQALAVKSHVFYWDRLTHQPELCKMMPLEESINITNLYDVDSLRMESLEHVSRVQFTVSAHWIQVVEGVQDIAPAISKFFPDNQIGSYTWSNFERIWPKKNQLPGDSGYQVVKSSLKETSVQDLIFKNVRLPKKYEKKDFYQKKDLFQKQEISQKDPAYRLQAKKWEATLLFSFSFKQRRKSEAHFFLESNFPLGKTKSCVISLKKLVDEEQSYTLFTGFDDVKDGDIVLSNGTVYVCQMIKNSSIASKDLKSEGLEKDLENQGKTSDPSKIELSEPQAIVSKEKGEEKGEIGDKKNESIKTVEQKDVPIEVKSDENKNDENKINKDESLPPANLKDQKEPKPRFKLTPLPEKTDAIRILQSQSFFHTHLGKSILKRSLERAKSVLSQESRTLRIHLTGRGSFFCGLKTNQTVLIEDSRLCSSPLKAKIISIKMHAQFEKLDFELVLAAYPFADVPAPIMPLEELCFKDYADQMPQDVYHPESFFYRSSLLDFVEVQNSITEQESKIGEWVAKKEVSQEEMDEFNTKMFIKMKSIKGKDLLEHQVNIATNRNFYPLYE